VADSVNQLTSSRAIVSSSGITTQEMRLWALAITNNTLITGNGSPESVVEAEIGREYADLDGATGSIKYFKKLDNIGGDKTQGWILI